MEDCRTVLELQPATPSPNPKSRTLTQQGTLCGFVSRFGEVEDEGVEHPKAKPYVDVFVVTKDPSLRIPCNTASFCRTDPAGYEHTAAS